MKKSPETMSRDEILYELLADMVGSVDPHSVFFSKVIEGGKNAGKYGISIGGKRITPVQAKNLQDEVKLLEQTQLWKLFTETLKHEAELRMFSQAKTTEDLFWGKAILHAIGIFESINKAIRNAEIEQLSPASPTG